MTCLSASSVMSVSTPKTTMSDPSSLNSIGDGTIPCKVNGKIVNFDPDTGANANIFGLDDFQAYCRETQTTPLLKRATRKLANASGGSMSVKGQFRAKLSSEHNSCMDTIYVLNQPTKYSPLLCEDALLRLGYIRYDLEGAFAEINRTKPVHKSSFKKDKHCNIVESEDISENDHDDISDEEFQQACKDLFKKYSKVFTGVGCFKNYKIQLQLKEDATPFVNRACNVAIHLRAKALERLNYFERLGIMEKIPANYPIKFLSPLLVVPKPDKDEVRLVANFKMLNLRLFRTRESPATKLEDFMLRTRGARFFFKLDLKHGYHQLVLDDASQELCLVATFNGTYRYKRLPMGIINAGDEFDRAVQATIHNCTKTIANRDDILAGSKTRKGLLNELNKVLSALLKAGFTCDPSKTRVGLTSIKFFGMIFNRQGMRPDPDKIAALLNSPRPNDQKALLSFICSCGWNMTYIPRFSEMVAPLRKLAKTKGKFIWEKIHETSFQHLKEALAQDCLNNTFHTNRKTIVYADAGKLSHDKSQPGGFSGVLVQIEPGTGRPLVVHYASRSISVTEAKWAQVELEARAIRYAIDKFRFYLEGHPGFIVMTDCKPLLPLFNKVPMPKSCPPRICRQIIALQDMSFQLQHCPGSRNIADWPSRCPLLDTSDIEDRFDSDVLETALIRAIYDERENDTLTIDKIKAATAVDDDLQFLIQRIMKNDFAKYRNDARIKPFTAIQNELSCIDGIIFKGEKVIVVPQALQRAVVRAIHQLAHSGETNTESLTRSHFFWPKLSNFVKSTVASCPICVHIRLPPVAPAGITYTPDKPHEEVSADFKGPLPDGSYCLVFMDLFSRYPSAYFSTSTSYEANRKHFVDYFSDNGAPVYLKTDGGPPFNGHRFAELLDEYGVKHKTIIPHHPQSNSEVETFNRTISKALKVAEIKKSNIRDEIMAAFMAKRATPHPSTGMSPFEAIHGYQINPGIIKGEIPTKQTVGLSRKQRKAIQDKLIASKIKTKMRADNKRNVVVSKIRQGDQVLVRLSKKEMPLPEVYTVTRVVHNDVTAESESGHVVRRHIDHFTLVNNPPTQPRQVDKQDEPDAGLDDLVDSMPSQPPAAGLVPPVAGLVFGTNQVATVPQQVEVAVPQGEAVPQPAALQQVGRQVRFAPTVQVRGPTRGLRSEGPAPDLPHVMSAALENSATARAEAAQILQDHDENQQNILD